MKQIVENISPSSGSGSGSYLFTLCPPVKPDQRNPKYSLFNFGLLYKQPQHSAWNWYPVYSVELETYFNLPGCPNMIHFEASQQGVHPKLEMMAKLNHPAQGSGVHFISNYFYHQHYLQTYSCNFFQISAPSNYVKRKEKERIIS